jgi:hypothetical protein
MASGYPEAIRFLYNEAVDTPNLLQECYVAYGICYKHT